MAEEDRNTDGTGLDWGNVAGAVAWSAGGAVGSAPFYAAGEVVRGPAGTTLTVTGAVIESGFNIGAVDTLTGQVRVRDLPGIVVGSVVGGFAGPAAGIGAGVIADQSLGKLVGAVEDLAALEDPDGGFNGENQQSPGYGSALVPNDNSGYGPINSGYGVGIPTGYEYNALDQIAHETHLRDSISSATPSAPSSNSGTERRSSDGGNKDDGGGTKTGGNGTPKNHSVPSDTGYATRGVNNLEGLEATGAGPISLYHRHGSGPDCRSWNT